MRKYTTKREKTNILLVFFVFFLSTRASGISNSNFVLFGALSYCLFMAYLRMIRIDRSFIFFIFIFSAIVFQNLLHLQEYFDLMRYLKLLSVIVISYLTIKMVKFDFFRHFSTIVYYVILISLPFYAWQLVSPGSLHSFGRALNSVLPGLLDIAVNVENTSLNILVYTIEFVENFRNSGIMWEPGGFATIIALAFYFEMLMTDFVFNKRSLVFLLGITTTFSTTGYLVTLIILLFVLSKKAATSTSRYFKPVLYFFATSFLIIAVVMFFESPIFLQKITEEIAVQQEVIMHMDDYDEGVKSLGRFGSMEVDLLSIQDKLFFGRGYTDENFRNEHVHFNFTNGLSTYFGRMGIVGLIWLLFSLHRSGKLIAFGLNPGGKGNILLLLVLLISFSNPVLFTPLYLTLQLFFIPFKVRKNETPLVYSNSRT